MIIADDAKIQCDSAYFKEPSLKNHIGPWHTTKHNTSSIARAFGCYTKLKLYMHNAVAVY